MPTVKYIQDTIDQQLDAIGLNASQASFLATGKRDAIQAIRRGMMPGANRLEQLSNALDLEFYFGPPRESISSNPLVSDLVEVAVYEGGLSAGGGAWNDEGRKQGSFSFPKNYIRGRLGHSNPDSLAILPVLGDSMEPTISNGDLVLIDRNVSNCLHDGVYAFLLDDITLIKRLHRQARGVLSVNSDNKGYENQTLRESDLKRLTIIGKACWILGKEI